MGSSPGWLKRASFLSFFGVKAVVFAIVAEYKKPLSGKIIDDGSMVMCELPRLSVAMGSLSLLALLLTVVAGHLVVMYPYPAKKLTVPHRALFRKASFTVFFLVAELVSVAALAILFWTTVTQHANLRFMPVVQDDGTLSCPATAKTAGMFGGSALLALDATLMWFVCLLMSLEARANYLDLHGDDDDVENDLKKKLDLRGDDDIDTNKKLDLHDDQDGNNEEHDGRDTHNVAYAEQSMILSPAQSAAR